MLAGFNASDGGTVDGVATRRQATGQIFEGDRRVLGKARLAESASDEVSAVDSCGLLH